MDGSDAPRRLRRLHHLGLLLACVAVIAVGVVLITHSSSRPPAPRVSLTASRSTMSVAGGTLVLHVQMPTACTLSSTPPLPGLPTRLASCADARVPVAIAPNTSTQHERLDFQARSEAAASGATYRASTSVTVLDRWRVSFFGDSLSYQAQPTMHAEYAATHQVETTAFTFPGSTMCAQVDEIRKTASSFHPDVVAIEFLGTSFVPCAQVAPWGTAKWLAHYRESTEAAVAAAESSGPTTTVLLFDSPVMPPASPQKPLIAITHIYEQVAAASKGRVTYVDAGRAVEGSEGQWVPSLPCLPGEIDSHRCTGPESPQGRLNPVRSPDGLHLCTTDYPAQAAIAPPGCPTYSSGAYRFGSAMVAGVLHRLPAG